MTNFKALFVLIFLATIVYSCSFPNKAATQRTNQLANDLSFLKPLILTEFKISTSFFQAYKIQNDSLRKYFASKGITELSIQYHPEKNESPGKLNLYSFDSLITFHINKSKNERYIYEEVVYSFSTQKPSIALVNLEGTKIKQVSDSLWILKTDSEVVMIF
jgi:hypothetical protein